MTIEEFFQACASHDWTYNYSDDHSVWERGCAAERKLTMESDTHPMKALIYNDWHSYVFSGPAFGTGRMNKPELTTYLKEAS